MKYLENKDITTSNNIKLYATIQFLTPQIITESIKSLWHKSDETPNINNEIIILFSKNQTIIGQFIKIIDNISPNITTFVIKDNNNTIFNIDAEMWAYVKDLLPI